MFDTLKPVRPSVRTHESFARRVLARCRRSFPAPSTSPTLIPLHRRSSPAYISRRFIDHLTYLFTLSTRPLSVLIRFIYSLPLHLPVNFHLHRVHRTAPHGLLRYASVTTSHYIACRGRSSRLDSIATYIAIWQHKFRSHCRLKEHQHGYLEDGALK